MQKLNINLSEDNLNIAKLNRNVYEEVEEAPSIEEGEAIALFVKNYFPLDEYHCFNFEYFDNNGNHLNAAAKYRNSGEDYEFLRRMYTDITGKAEGGFEDLIGYLFVVRCITDKDGNYLLVFEEVIGNLIDGSYAYEIIGDDYEYGELK